MSPFSITREEMERHANYVWDLTIEKLFDDGVITRAKADEYLGYSLVVITKESIAERFSHFFKGEEPGKTMFRYRLVKMEHEL